MEVVWDDGLGILVLVSLWIFYFFVKIGSSSITLIRQTKRLHSFSNRKEKRNQETFSHCVKFPLSLKEFLVFLFLLMVFWKEKKNCINDCTLVSLNFTGILITSDTVFKMSHEMKYYFFSLHFETLLKGKNIFQLMKVINYFPVNFSHFYIEMDSNF